MLSADDVRILDLNSAWHGVPKGHLMQSAGRAVADVAEARFRPKRVLVLAGPSNNGGDGAVAAKRLQEQGAQVTVLYASDPALITSGEAASAYHALDRRAIRIETFRTATRTRELAKDADLIIDALLGIGIHGELREPITTLVRVANASRKPILAVDVPTGFGSRLHIRAQATVTLHDRKRAMTPATCGRVLVRDIGIPKAAQTEVGPGHLAVRYPRNAPGSHKGENGRLLVVAGGPYTGAPIIASLAALRTGADLVHLLTPRHAAVAARAVSPDLIVHAGSTDDRLVPDDLPIAEDLLPRVDAVLVGPGLGTHRATQAAVESILASTQRRRLPLVLDADAFPVAGKNPALLSRRPIIATPHRREFRDLTGRALPKEGSRARGSVSQAATRLRSTLLVKGPLDIVSDGRRTLANRIHHPWMTVGGTGDALAGIAAAFTAKHLPVFDAACAAAALNGLAGLKAYEVQSWAARASDLVDAIPGVLRDWLAA